MQHNGVVIHDNVELPRSHRAAPVKEGPEPGPIYLQDHGNPVRFRNIWLVEKKGWMWVGRATRDPPKVTLCHADSCTVLES